MSVKSEVLSFEKLRSFEKLSQNQEQKPLIIPDYQRPYVWGEEQVKRLIDDLNSKEYNLLGNIILYESDRVYEIVDGQQRLTTIKLILKALDEKSSFLGNAEYFHEISHKNIKKNYEFIKSYAYDKKEKILKNLNNSEFITITTTDLDKAFLFFDSTNSKGLDLKQYDLIKAFHLESLEQKSSDLAINEALCFEKLCENEDEVEYFFKEFMYWLRKHLRDDWSENSVMSEFCKENLQIQSSYNQGVLADFADGLSFFNYTKKYYELFKSINNSTLMQQINTLSNFHLKIAAQMCLFLYLDKFLNGEFDNISRRIIRIIYSVRITHSAVSWGSIREILFDTLKIIYFSNYESELKQKLDIKIEECYKEEEQNHKGLETIETSRYLEIMQDELKRANIKGHYHGK